MEEPLLHSVLLNCSTLILANSLGQDNIGGEGCVETRSLWSQLSQRYSNTHKCVSSKAALLILLWSSVLGLWNGVIPVLNPDLYLRLNTQVGATVYAFVLLALTGFVFFAFIL